MINNKLAQLSFLSLCNIFIIQITTKSANTGAKMLIKADLPLL